MKNTMKQKEVPDVVGYKSQFNSHEMEAGLRRPFLGSHDWNDTRDTTAASRLQFDKCEINSVACLQLSNLLEIPGLEQRGVFTRFCYYCYMTTSRYTGHFYPTTQKLRRAVLDNERVHRAVQKTLCVHNNVGKLTSSGGWWKNQQAADNMLHRASTLLDGMLATVTGPALKFCGWLFLSILRRITSSVHVHLAQLRVIRKLSEGDKPIIYLPLHFSHFDYILLSLLLYHNEIRSPFVASGDNLQLPLFGYVMRRVGGFFIRRKIDIGENKDYIYRAVLKTFVTEILREKQSLEVFIEGTRTRSGLPNTPKTGVLEIAVNAVESGVIDDAVIVPLCMCYEKLIDGSFEQELMGHPKVPESFWKAMVTTFKMLTGYYGHIRMNFGAPRSLKKTIAELKASPACSFDSDQTSELPRAKSLYEQVTPTSDLPEPFEHRHHRSSSTPSVAGVTSNHARSNPASPHKHHHTLATAASYSSALNLSAEERDCKLISSLLAEHCVYRSMTCKVFMSTNLVAFLLLHEWRSGVSMPVLVHSFQQLVTQLLAQKWDVGFSGDFRDVVLHATSLLGCRLVHLDTIDYNPRLMSPPAHRRKLSLSKTDSGIVAGGTPVTPDHPVVVDDSPEADLAVDGSPRHEKSSDSGQVSDSSDVEVGATGGGKEVFETPQLRMKIDDDDDELMPSTGEYMTLTESGVYLEDQLLNAESQRSHTSMFSGFKGVLKTDEERVLKRFQQNARARNDVCFFVKPELGIPQVFELAYYSNALTPVFAIQSVAALAVGATLEYRFSTLEMELADWDRVADDDRDRGIPVDQLPEQVSRSFTRSDLIERIIDLTDLLQIDLILCDVTEDLETVANRAVDSLIASNLLVSETLAPSCRGMSQLADELSFGNPDDVYVQEHWLKVNLTSIPQLISKQSIMASHVEGYMVASSNLALLLRSPEVTEAELKRTILKSAQERVYDGVAIRAESASSDVVRNALRSFESNGIVSRCGEARKSFRLTDDFADIESVANFVSRISQYLM